MPVTEIPLSLIPGTKVSIDGSAAVQGLSTQPHRVTVIGTKLAAGSHPPEVPVIITREDEGDALFGAGSMLAQMCRTFRKVNRRIELTAIALAEDAAGQKAAQTVTFTGPATAAGTLHLLTAGVPVKVGVAEGDTATTIAAAYAAAVTALTRIPVTSASALGVTTNTCRWKGASGNALATYLNYYEGEKTPAGVTVTITAFTAGTTDADITDAIAVMGPKQCHTIVNPYTDTANMNALKVELEARWGPTKLNEGLSFAAFRGNYSASQTYGNGRNSKTEVVMGTGLSPTPPWVWAANLAAEDSLITDPAEPRTGVALTQVLPPVSTDRFDEDDQQLLLMDGVSTYTVSDAGVVAIQQAFTTYQTNDLNVPDTAFQRLNTLRCASYYRQDMAQFLGVRYAKHKVADDGTPVGAGQKVATPSLVRGSILGRYDRYMGAAICEDRAAFEESLSVERHPDNPGRIDIISYPNFVNQLDNIAMRASFIL